MEDRNRYTFSAAKIQDYLDCERRFELKYIFKQSWPAIASEPVIEIEENIRKGNKFHYLIHQFYSGIPESILLNLIDEEEILDWFNSFLFFNKTLQIEKAFSEFHLSSQIGEIRLSAVFDLIYLTKNDKVGIIDWKTSHFIPKKSTLAMKVQTIMYPYLINETFHEFLAETNLLPENISMRYWYPGSPDEEFIFKYGQSTHEDHHVFLKNIINEILGKKKGDFLQTCIINKCGYCQYRSLCDRGIRAANIHEIEDQGLLESGFLIDFDQLPELSFDE